MKRWAQVRPISAVTRLVGGAVCVLLFSFRSLAFNSAFEFNQYAHMGWTQRDGMLGATQSIVQTPDGYLWLGTEFGLVRFDGVRFVHWSPPSGQRLPGSDIMSLLAARDGTLWVGTNDGLASFHNGSLAAYAAIDREPVFALLEDHVGTVWVGLRGRICAIRTGNVECSDGRDKALGPMPDHVLSGVGVFSLFEDNKGRLWAGEAQSGLWQWAPGPPRQVLTGPMNSTQALAQADDSASFLAVSGGALWQVSGNNTHEHPIPGVRQPGARVALRDRNGSLWIGTWQQGLLHVYNGKTTRFTHGDGLSSDAVTSLFEDNEGTIWVGTTSGLDRFRESAVYTISEKQGLHDQAWSVLAARDGSVWIGTDQGVNRWRDGQMTLYHSAFGHSTPVQGERNGAPRVVTDAGLPDNKIGSLFEDRRGRIWVTGREGAAWFESGRFTRVKGRLPVGAANAIIGDMHDGVWISYPGAGRFHVVDGKIVESVEWPWSDNSDPRLSVAVGDPVKGGLWIGFKHEGLAYLNGRGIDASFASEAGLRERVWNLQVDHEGTLWAATERGLVRVRNAQLASLTTRNGLPCDAIHWVIEDDASSLWLYSACGLVRITRPELQAWASNPQWAIQSTKFDGADGVTSRALLSPYTPVVSKSPDGKIWFAHLDGVSVVDPLALHANGARPPVHIEQIEANARPYAPSRGLTLPPRVRDLSIRYTALSLAAPEKIHFRFKLEPQDENWREVVNVREIEYSNLPPGNYRFHVTASNDSGVWNESGDTLEFSIAAAYYQTNVFRVSCIAALVLVTWSLYRYRVHQVAREFNARLEGRVDERLRVARELHDTLLQSFHGLMLRFQSVHNLLPGRVTEAKQVLAQALDDAAKAILDARDAVQDLRSSSVADNDLPQAIKTLGEVLSKPTEALGGAAPAFSVHVEGTPQDLHPILRDEVYRIASEALGNAFQHARARRIEVEIRYDADRFRLRVRDDGIGIGSNIPTEGRTAHWGLIGMRERAKSIQGQLEVWSEAGAGTEVELLVRAAIAYRGHSRQRSRVFGIKAGMN